MNSDNPLPQLIKGNMEALKIQIPLIEVNGETVDPDAVTSSRMQMLQFSMLAALNGQMVKMNKLLQEQRDKETFQGKIDPRTPISVTDQMQEINLINEWPYTGWVGFFCVNDGPDTLYLGINNTHELIEIRSAETRTISHQYADKRIEKLYLNCASGETASLRIEGQY